jgi:hypothetical protein
MAQGSGQDGPPTKRPVTKRPVTKRPFTKRPVTKGPDYQTSRLLNVQLPKVQITKHPVYQTSSYQTSSYRTSILVIITKYPFLFWLFSLTKCDRNIKFAVLFNVKWVLILPIYALYRYLGVNVWQVPWQNFIFGMRVPCGEREEGRGIVSDSSCVFLMYAWLSHVTCWLGQAKAQICIHMLNTVHIF